MSDALVIGLDVGTTACKALAVEQGGAVAAWASADYPLHAPAPGAAEQDVREVWAGVCESLHKLNSKLRGRRLAAIALSGAMHSVLPVDEAGEPLAQALTWADTRAIEEARQLREKLDPADLYQRTGCPLQWTYHLPRLAWLRNRMPQVFAKARRCVAIKEWVLHELTGTWVTDRSMASSTGLLSLAAREWDAALLKEAGIGAEQLPQLAEVQDIVGHVNTAAAAQTLLPAGLPVMPGGSDGGMANLGAGAVEPGTVVITIGTSGAVRITTHQPLLDPQQRTWCYILTRDCYLAGGAINNGGLAVDWVRRLCYGELDKDAGFTHLFADAATMEPGCEGVVVHPFLTGERTPHWRADLTASITGLSPRHGRAHVARAVLEGVARCVADVFAVLREQGADVRRIRLTGGVTQSRLWSQIVADAIGHAVEVSEAGDASALGAAVVGWWGVAGSAKPQAFADAGFNLINCSP